VPILPKERGPRLITIRRGGTLTYEHHRLLADWALSCAEHVLHLFEDHQPGDSRPRDAIGAGRAWIRGETRMMAAVRELVLDDQRRRSAICWHVFDD
jgi:immunity protein 5 of polymorphic toxin system